jgi:hypothetical protein
VILLVSGVERGATNKPNIACKNCIIKTVQVNDSFTTHNFLPHILNIFIIDLFFKN